MFYNPWITWFTSHKIHREIFLCTFLNWNNDSVCQLHWLLKLNSLSYSDQILTHQVPRVFLQSLANSVIGIWTGDVSGPQWARYPTEAIYPIDRSSSSYCVYKKKQGLSTKMMEEIFSYGSGTDLVVGKKKRWCNNALRSFFQNTREYFSRIY